MKEFIETRKLFEEAIGMTAPISYTQWLELPDNKKAAALFVNFYNRITLAWQKAYAEYVDEEDAISILMQYILKNVPIIMTDPKRYTDKYMYTVAFNSMSALRRVKGAQERYNNTTEQYFNIDGDEVNKFDSISEDELADTLHRVADILVDIYSDLDASTRSVIQNIISGKKLTSKAQREESMIYHKLRTIFADFADDFLSPKLSCETFADVLKYDNLIDSAVVKMRDGVKAVYCGEKRVSDNGKTEIVFIGPMQDYILPISVACNLKVISVDMYD